MQVSVRLKEEESVQTNQILPNMTQLYWRSECVRDTFVSRRASLLPIVDSKRRYWMAFRTPSILTPTFDTAAASRTTDATAATEVQGCIVLVHRTWGVRVAVEIVLTKIIRG